MNGIARALGLLAGLFATGIASAADAPFLWQVEGPRARHYLMGSIHLLPASAHPLPAALERAFDETAVLMLETDLEALAEPALQARVLAAAAAPRGLAAEIDADLLAGVRARAAALGLPVSACEAVRAWFCALTLEMTEARRAGLDPALGLDQHFLRRAQAAGRPLHGLETPQAQMDLLAGMSGEEADAFLRATLREAGAGAAALRPETLVAMWRRNDTAGLAGLLRDMERHTPALHERLLAARNRAWAGALQAPLQGTEPLLVVVGAAHLVGPEDLVGLLRARGFEVRAVAPD